MSKIGKQPIIVPEGVEIKIGDHEVLIKGPKGELNLPYSPQIRIEKRDNVIKLMPLKIEKETKALWGLTRALLANTIEGVTKGFEKKLEIHGVGYRAQAKGDILVLDVGFSHQVEIGAPEGIEFKVEKNIVTVSGIDKQLVGSLSAEIRRVRPPEVYKGKGIRYVGEKVRRKVGKKVAAVEGVGEQ